MFFKASHSIPFKPRPAASTHASVPLAAALGGEKLPWFEVVGLPVDQYLCHYFLRLEGLV